MTPKQNLLRHQNTTKVIFKALTEEIAKSGEGIIRCEKSQDNYFEYSIAGYYFVIISKIEGEASRFVTYSNNILHGNYPNRSLESISQIEYKSTDGSYLQLMNEGATILRVEIAIEDYLDKMVKYVNNIK